MIRVLAGLIRRNALRDALYVCHSASAARGKLSGARWRVNLRALAGCALCGALFAGCIRPSRAIQQLPEGDWTVRLGDAANAPFLHERVPRAVRVEWDADVGRGLPVAAIVQQDLIISAVSGGGIITLRADDGRRFWGRRFNGAVAGQVLRSGSRIYFATQHRNGTLYALDLSRGRRIWSRRIGAPAAAEPAYADGVIYLTTIRDVQAVDAGNGNLLWRERTSSAPAQAPIVIADELLVAVRDTLFHFGRADGSVNARTELAGEPSAPLAVRGDTIFIAMHPGIVAAYVDGGAREVWRQSLRAPILAAPVVTDDGVFVLTREGELYLLGPNRARRIVALDRAATESLSITADGALIGTLDGRIVFVRHDGSIAWEEQLDGSVRAPAVVHESNVYVGTLNGRLVKLTSG
jgi:outer membrane protein assembly factor BamB